MPLQCHYTDIAWLEYKGHSETALEIHSLLNQLELLLNGLDDSLIDTLSNQDADQKIAALLDAIHNVHEYHARSVAQKLNIFIGFSGADGD